MKLFLNHAFLFYRNAHLILSDSRMSFAAVSISFEKGKRESRKVALGAFVEWWLNCKEEVTNDNEGNDALIFHLVGNAMTRTNKCCCVYPDGHVGNVILNSFGKAWSSFMNTCKKYAEKKDGTEVLSLEEVVNVLCVSEMGIDTELTTLKYNTIKNMEASGDITGLMIERFLQEGISNNLSEEKQMEVNMSYERYRKALIRSAQDNKHLIDSAGKSIYVLERTCLDNMINRSVSSPIAVAETMEELIDFCRSMYGDDIPFDDKGRTPTIRIPMGEASFQIKTVAYLVKDI